MITADPVPPITKGSLVQNASIDQLVSDTKDRKKSYEGSLVFLTAEVRRNSDNETLWLTTNGIVNFAIFASGDRDTRQFTESYIEGQTYDFVLYIKEQEHPNLTDEFTFNDNRWYVWTYLIEGGGNIRNITIDQLTSDTKQDGTSYQGNVVSFNTKVEFVLGNFITLETNDNDVDFFLLPTGNPSSGTFQKSYVSGNSYDFILYIREQEQPDENDDSWSIWSYIVE